jgi:hypothetical protein
LAPHEKRTPTSLISFEYDTATTGLDDLPRIKTWQSRVRVFADGAQFTEGNVTKTFVKTMKVLLGKCKYDAWVIDDHLVIGTDDSTYRQSFVPALGLVVSSDLLGPDGQPVSRVRFDGITAETK